MPTLGSASREANIEEIRLSGHTAGGEESHACGEITIFEEKKTGKKRRKQLLTPARLGKNSATTKKLI